MHCARAVLHTFAGKLGREGDGEAPRGDSKRSKDTNLAPTRPGIGKEARMGREEGEQVFFASRAIKGESAGVGSVLKMLMPCAQCIKYIKSVSKYQRMISRS